MRRHDFSQIEQRLLARLRGKRWPHLTRTPMSFSGELPPTATVVIWPAKPTPVCTHCSRQQAFASGQPPPVERAGGRQQAVASVKRPGFDRDMNSHARTPTTVAQTGCALQAASCTLPLRGGCGHQLRLAKARQGGKGSATGARDIRGASSAR